MWFNDGARLLSDVAGGSILYQTILKISTLKYDRYYQYF